MKNKSPSDNEKERIIEEFQKLLEERGRKPLEMARKAILEEEIESKEVKEALHYFITEYWHDLARPTLMSICCEAVGGDPNATIPFAVPLSLISGALDIQDDIIDQSKTKHGQPTVYGKYGKEIAILAADALLFEGFTLLHEACLEIAKEKAQKIMKIIKNMFYELGDAEALELRLRGKLNVGLKEYLEIINKKAADVEAYTSIATILSDAPYEKTEKLAKYGRLLGIIIIIRDDILDILETNEIKNRILKEHLPLPIICLPFEEKIRLRKVIEKRRINKSDIRFIQNIVKKNRGLILSREIIGNFALQALKEVSDFHNTFMKIFVRAVVYDVDLHLEVSNTIGT